MPIAHPFLSLLTGSFSSPAGGNPAVAMVEADYRDLVLDARSINYKIRLAGLADACSRATTGAEAALELHEDLELLTFAGSVAIDGSHLHLSVADATGRAEMAISRVP